jgi:hypothetical protein
MLACRSAAVAVVMLGVLVLAYRVTLTGIF